MGRPKQKKRMQAAIETGLARFFTAWLRLLPHDRAQRWGGRIGVFFHDIFRIRVKHARQELLRAFPDRDEEWAKRTTREVYRNFGMLAAETARIPTLVRRGRVPDAVRFDEDSVKALERALDRGKGVIIASGHLGNWELTGTYASQVLKQPINFVVGRQSNSAIEEMIDDLRRSGGMKIIKRDEAARGIPRALRGNEICAIMIDQDARDAGTFVPFFGRLASTTRGVGIFALKYDASVLFLESWRDQEGVIRVILDPVEVPRAGDRDQDVHALMARLTARLEEGVRRHPEQWLWLHRRFKTPPPGMDTPGPETTPASPGDAPHDTREAGDTTS